MFTVDIDTGGTMTDALVSDGSRRHAFKVDTTAHDYTISFLACLREAAAVFADGDLVAFLRQVRVIRWSSTITTNVLAERRGAKVGLLVSRGHEEDLYGSGRSPVVGELIQEKAIIGLSDAPQDAEILAAVKDLLESGVRRICVALRDAFPDNRAEVAVKRVIESQYPDHIIGAVPVLLGSDMAQIGHDQTRVHYSLMNAYTHNQLATSLFRAEDMLREDHGWTGALLVGHTSGGVSRIGKTKAVDTIESGPVFGTFGGAYMAREYGLDNVICFDVGGTTTKASVVREGRPVLQRGGSLMEVPVKSSFALLRSAAVGGGSVARAADGRVTIGPDSMGAAPGPACYGLGGTQATLTDALLVLGYLDADTFLGGRRTLDLDKSRKAIDKHVATPLNLDIESAALAIRDEAVALMAELVQSILEEAALAPEQAAIFAFGGNGPMFGALVADKLGMPSVHAFDVGPVFSAFGSGVSDVVHVYARGVGVHVAKDDAVAITAMAAALHQQAVRDFAGEGFPAEQASYLYEAEFGEGEDLVGSATFIFDAAPDGTWFDALQAASQHAGVDLATAPLQLLRLSASFAVERQPMAEAERVAESAAPTARPIGFNGAGLKSTPAHVWESLAAETRIDGPAMVNGATLTCPVPPGWSLTVDRYGNAAMQRANA